MKLLVAVVSNDDANKVQKGLVKEGFMATRLAAKGGFLKERNAVFLIGVNDEKVPEVLDLFEKHSRTRNKIVPNAIVNEFGAFSALPIEVTVGGATVFIMNVDQFIKV